MQRVNVQCQGSLVETIVADEVWITFIIKPSLANGVALCNGDILLFLCSFVCLFVCLSPVKFVKSFARWQHVTYLGFQWVVGARRCRRRRGGVWWKSLATSPEKIIFCIQKWQVWVHFDAVFTRQTTRTITRSLGTRFSRELKLTKTVKKISKNSRSDRGGSHHRPPPPVNTPLVSACVWRRTGAFRIVSDILVYLASVTAGEV